MPDEMPDGFDAPDPEAESADPELTAEELRAAEEEAARDYPRVMGRIRIGAVLSYLLFAAGTLIWRGFRPWLGLTCAAGAAMIAFLWLEGIVSDVLRTSPHPEASRLGARVIVRFIVLLPAFALAVWAADFDAVSVVLGGSVIVAGIFLEAVRAVVASLTNRGF